MLPPKDRVRAMRLGERRKKQLDQLGVPHLLLGPARDDDRRLQAGEDQGTGRVGAPLGERPVALPLQQ